MPMVVGLPLTFTPYVFVSDYLHVSICGTSFFFTFYKTLQTLAFGVSVRLA